MNQRTFCRWSATVILLVMTGASAAAISRPASLSVAEFYRLHAVPGECGKKLRVEGKSVAVTGDIDWHNIFEKRSYPQLPYEKFTLRDKSDRKLAIEVWGSSKENERIFDKIARLKERGEAEVMVRGVAEGFDLPLMGRCTRGIRIRIHSEKDLVSVSGR